MFYKQQCKNNEGSLAYQKKRIRVRVGAKMICIFLLGISSSFMCTNSFMFLFAKRIVRYQYCQTCVPMTLGTRVEDIPSKNILSSRQLVREFSSFGKQGYLHCSCTAACKTNKCKCNKKSILTCNSRCHPGKNVKIMNNLCFHFAINLERSTIFSHYYF